MLRAFPYRTLQAIWGSAPESALLLALGPTEPREAVPQAMQAALIKGSSRLPYEMLFASL